MNAAIAFVQKCFDAVVGTVLPPKERVRRSALLSLENIPLSPVSHDLLGASITALMDYREEAVRDLVQSLKYDGNGHAARLAAGAIAEFLHEELANERRFSQKRIILVPLPLHASRQRSRGYNQIELALRALPQEFQNGDRAMLAPHVLTRSRETRPQTTLSRHERLSNVAGAFEARQPHMVQNTHVFLIDDVATTGATLVNAGTALRRAGATVSLVALARA